MGEGPSNEVRLSGPQRPLKLTQQSLQAEPLESAESLGDLTMVPNRLVGALVQLTFSGHALLGSERDRLTESE